MHIHRGEKTIKGMHIPKGRSHFLIRKPCFLFVLPYACFLVALWYFELCLVSIFCYSHRIVFMCWTCIYPYAIVFY